MDNPNEVPPLPNPPANPIYTDEILDRDRFQAIDPDNPSWGIVGALLVWFASIVVQLIIPLFFVLPYILYLGGSPASPDFAQSAAQIAVKDPTAILLQVISIFPTHLLILVLVWALVTGMGRRPFLASFGWSWSRRLRLWQSIALGIALFAVASGLVKLLGADQPTPLEQLISSSMGARYAIAILAVFTAPFIEEFLYRGVLYSALQRTIGVNGAVVLVLGLFTIIHVPQYRTNVGVIAAVGLLSIVLTIIRASTGRLLPCVIIHMAFNAVQAVFLIIEPYAQRALTPTEPSVPAVSILSRLVVFLS